MERPAEPAAPAEDAVDAAPAQLTRWVAQLRPVDGTPAAAAAALAALESLYRRESGPVYRYLLALSGEPALAADATQEAFVVLATQPVAFDADRGASVGAYLAGIARHALFARWRERAREQPVAEDLAEAAGAEGEAPAADGLDPESALVRRQDIDALWRAIRLLPVPFREAVVLVDLQERSYMQAARIAGVEVNTLRTRLHRGRARLAALLTEAAAAPAQATAPAATTTSAPSRAAALRPPGAGGAAFQLPAGAPDGAPG